MGKIRAVKVRLCLTDHLEIGYDSEEDWAPNPHQEKADMHVYDGSWAGQEVLQDYQQRAFSEQCELYNAMQALMPVGDMLPYDDMYSWTVPSAPGCWTYAEDGGDCNWMIGQDPDASFGQSDSCAVNNPEDFSEVASTGEPVGGCASEQGDTSTSSSEPGSDEFQPLGTSSSSSKGSRDSFAAAAAAMLTGERPMLEEDLVLEKGSSTSSDEAARRLLEHGGIWRPDIYMKLSHTLVPRRADFSKPEFDRSACTQQGDTTMMLRNLPNEYNRSMLMAALDERGFHGAYDFIYLPIDKCTRWNVGYAFVNFIDADSAERCKRELTGHRFPSEDPRPEKITQVCRAHVQGLEKNVEYYKRSAVMSSRDETHRPLILPGGVVEPGGLGDAVEQSP